MTGNSKTNLYIDLTLFGAFLVAMEPDFSGLTVHEWLGLALGAGLLIHLLLHWKWVIGVLKRVFQPLVWRARLNLILNTALLTAFSLIIISGVMISETLGTPQLFGVTESAHQAWREIHHMASDLSLVLVGLHMALHWQWIVSTFKRYVLRRRPASPARRQALSREELSTNF